MCDDFYHANDEGGQAREKPEIGIERQRLNAVYDGMAFNVMSKI